MFECLPLLQLATRFAAVGRSADRHFARGMLSIGLAIALAISAIPALAAATGPVASADQTPDSIQYQEYLSHGTETYSFTPGIHAAVSYRPRTGDTETIDGAKPVALPAGYPAQPAPVAPSSAAAEGTVRPAGTLNPLRREVFGFLPYWELSSTLDYDTLSTIAYFGVSVGSDGNLYEAGNGWAGWNSSTMTTIINTAHAHGTRVVLTAQAFAWGTSEAASQTALLSSPTARQNAAATIAATVRSRGVDGVDLDFEPIASGQRSNYVLFVQQLRIELDKLQPGYELTFCATGAPGTYDLPNLLAPGAADAVFIMGYNLRGGDPATAGSIDPLASTLTRYTLTSVVGTYLGQVPASKVILGLPWYGAAYSTAASHSLNAAVASAVTYGKPVESYYSTLSGLASMSDSTHLGKSYDIGEQTAWTAYYGTFGGQPTWREGYFDDARALGAKCDAIDGWNLRGVGIWALGYDNNNGDGDLTGEIAAKFETGAAGTTFHPLDPVRIVDTRIRLGIAGKLLANVPQTFLVAGLNGVDGTATAVTGNLTVVNETKSGALYLGPYATSRPSTSTINFAAGSTTGNGVTIGLSATGSLSAVYMASAGNTTNLVFDLTGFFTPDTKGATYHPMRPVRAVDTRIGLGTHGKLAAKSPRVFQVSTENGIPKEAVAVTANIAVVNSSRSGALYLGPTSLAAPLASTINFSRSQIVANNATVPLSPTGSLSATYLAPQGNTTDFVLDITGYYTLDASGVRFVPITPARYVDTRSGLGGSGGKLRANTPRSFVIDGLGSVPMTATAITGNVAVVNETRSGAMFVGPDSMAKPSTSTLNFVRGDIRANGITVMVGGSPGSLSATYMAASGNTMDLVLDITGYFVP